MGQHLAGCRHVPASATCRPRPRPAEAALSPQRRRCRQAAALDTRHAAEQSPFPCRRSLNIVAGRAARYSAGRDPGRPVRPVGRSAPPTAVRGCTRAGRGRTAASHCIPFCSQRSAAAAESAGRRAAGATRSARPSDRRRSGASGAGGTPAGGAPAALPSRRIQVVLDRLARIGVIKSLFYIQCSYSCD